MGPIIERDTPFCHFTVGLVLKMVHSKKEAVKESAMAQSATRTIAWPNETQILSVKNCFASVSRYSSGFKQGMDVRF